MKIENSNVCRDQGINFNCKTNKKVLETNDVSMKTRANGKLYITIESPSINKDINERTQIVFNSDEIKRIRILILLFQECLELVSNIFFILFHRQG